jgi:hypothetical protein
MKRMKVFSAGNEVDEGKEYCLDMIDEFQYEWCSEYDTYYTIIIYEPSSPYIHLLKMNVLPSQQMQSSYIIDYEPLKVDTTYIIAIYAQPCYIYQHALCTRRYFNIPKLITSYRLELVDFIKVIVYSNTFKIQKRF